ncbi:Diguanylate cyclase/phosphodiesterase domain 2 (EAL) [Marinomonas sp. MED121]|uniref:GGDEF domain-containing protein n=1 Tax=Marinomonas sp. MED121 TaxID=314277 RepID=UPI000068FE00|nr:diguanylate cyclase [Marinomonas sp. MED121]EAQ65485.1 Diguanylate cyclase/phosphodiesterase domain 2 (EAL) [Marinomonas sp. MED121]
MSDSIQDNQLRQLLSNQINEAILIVKADDAQCLYASPLASEYLQLADLSLESKSLFEIDAELKDFAQWQSYTNHLRSDTQHTRQSRYFRKDGSELSVEVRVGWITYQDTDSLLLTVRDISARKDYEQRVVNDEILRTFCLHEAQDGYWDWNLVENSLYLSPHCYRLMGIEPSEVSGSILDQWLDVIHPNDKKAAFETIDNHVKGKTERFKIKYRLRQKEGGYIWVQGRGATVARDEMGFPTRILGSVIDITESESTTQTLLWHSQYDALTKVYNRKKGYEFFHDYLQLAQQAFAENKPGNFQVAVLDIDDFKQVNDQYGHLIGDALLQHFSEFVQGYLEDNMILARWGGEEFVLLSYGHKDDDFILRIDQLIRNYAITSFKPDTNKPIHTSVSVGVCCFKDGADTISSLFRAADAAMYKAKGQGKNTLCIA